MSTASGAYERICRVVPAARWVPGYRLEDLPRDALAGALVSVLLIPQAMAYASLAGLPPSVGLYAAIAPAAVYALFGTSQTLSVGPVALISLLIGDAIARADAEPLQAAYATAALVGAMLIALGALRLGRLVNFVSDPVLIGFTAAAAVLIAASQLATLLGLDIERSGTLAGAVPALWAKFEEVHPPSLAVGLTALGAFVTANRLGDRWLQRYEEPGAARIALVKSSAMIILGTTIAVSYLLSLHASHGVAILGNVGAGLPTLTVPPLDPGLYLTLAPDATAAAVVLFVTATAVAKQLAGQQRTRINTSQEALALGAANTAAAFTGGYAVGSSISRSVLNAQGGARTPMASIVTAALVLAATLFIAPVLYFLPEPALAALVISAIFGLVKLEDMRDVWRYDRPEAAILIVTAAATLGLGVTFGLLIGTLASIFNFLWRGSQPRIVLEGARGDGREFRSQDRRDVEVVDGDALVVRVDRSLFFANVDRVEERLLNIIAGRDDLKALVFDMKAVNRIDSSGYRMLKRLQHTLEQRDVRLAFAEAHRPVQVHLRATLGSDGGTRGRFYPSCREALDALGATETAGNGSARA